ncbi:MAG: YebC/PmpR family DNA-binding transcriptional regulator [Bacilli bacterium]
MGRAHEVRAASMAKTAASKSKLYSVYAKEIYQAAKSNPDPVNNLELKRVIEKAKKEQIPADVINRNIDKVKKGVIEDYQVIEYEAFAQGKSNLIIKCLTDNTNRSLSSVKTVFNKCGAKMASIGSVSFMYDHLGALGFTGYNEEDIMNTLFEENVEVIDIENENNLITVYCDPKDLNIFKTILENKYKDIKFDIDEIAWYPKDYTTLQEEELDKFKRLITLLEEIDDVSNVYHNVKI